MAVNPKAKKQTEDAAPRTKRRAFWCVCPLGHRFAAELYSSVDLDERPEAIETLSDSGMQPARCADCGAEIWLAEAFVIHQPSRRRSVLFVPDALAHRDLVLEAEFLCDSAASASTRLQPHVAKPETAVGVAALQRWLFGDAVPVSTAPPPRPRELHAAFKDLEEPERPSNRPSLPPLEPQMDGVDVNEPLLDEDWLADDAIAPSRQKGARRGEKGSAGEAEAARPGRRRTSGVDFAGLLADDDGDAERPGAKKR